MKLKTWWLFAAVSLLCLTTGCEKPAEAQLKYQAWMKVYGVTNLTFAEWDALRGDNMLPGQKPRNSDSDAATGMAIGIAVGSSMNAGRK